MWAGIGTLWGASRDVLGAKKELYRAGKRVYALYLKRGKEARRRRFT